MSRWVDFVAEHGVVLASGGQPRRLTTRADRRGAARNAGPGHTESASASPRRGAGPVPSVAEAVAGEPIRGSWWGHPRGKAIFDALTAIGDSPDVRCFKLVGGKVTFVHRRLWPALVRLAGELGADALAEIRQEHTPTGEHRNVVTPYPRWVDAELRAAAARLSLDEARAQLPVLSPARRAPASRSRGGTSYSRRR